MQDQFYQTPFQKRSRASEFRAAARTALKGHWWMVIGVFLLASLLGVELGYSLPHESALIEKLEESPVAFWNEIKTLDKLLLDRGAWGFVKYIAQTLTGGESVKMLIAEESFVWCVAFFVGAPITVGFHNFLIELAERHPHVGVKTMFHVFSNCYWHSVLLRVLITLLYLGVGLLTLGLTFGVLALGASLGYGWMVWCALGVMLLGGLFNLILQYKLALCYHIVDDFPEMTPSNAIRNSIALMKGNTLRYFRLQISFVGWVLVAMLTFGVGMIWLTPYMVMTNTLFYAEVSGRNTAKEVEFPSIDPEDYYPSV